MVIALILLATLPGCIVAGGTTQRTSPLSGVNIYLTEQPDGARDTHVVISGEADVRMHPDGTIEGTSRAGNQVLTDMIRVGLGAAGVAR